MQEGDQLGDPKGSLPDLDMEIHGKRPGAHQALHEVPLPVGELGMDGCRDSRILVTQTDTAPTHRGRQSHLVLPCLASHHSF